MPWSDNKHNYTKRPPLLLLWIGVNLVSHYACFDGCRKIKCVDILLTMRRTRESRHKIAELYLHVDLLLKQQMVKF